MYGYLKEAIDVRTAFIIGYVNPKRKPFSIAGESVFIDQRSLKSDRKSRKKLLKLSADKRRNTVGNVRKSKRIV